MKPGHALFLIIALGAGGLAGAPGEAAGQPGPPLQVQGQQDLAFGELIGGVPRAVDPADPVHGAQFRLRAGGRTVEVSFLLPDALVRVEGGEIPLRFGAQDAFFERQGGGNQASRIPFDPTTPLLLEQTGPPGGWTWIHLGGTALPPARAPLGEYRNMITITIADLGS